MRKEFRYAFLFYLGLSIMAALLMPKMLWGLVFLAPIVLLGAGDYLQKGHTLRRNFPVLAHFRYLLEQIRPEIQQYFIESNLDGMPFSREQRALVYQRAKKVVDTLPFGTQRDVYQPGYEWLNHSLMPAVAEPAQLRITIGGAECRQPYSASIFNISSMSYGALSQNAVRALNHGAKLGGFVQATGEGGVSPYHLEPGGDLIWQIGTGYFGCRNANGGFDEGAFAKMAQHPHIKMIEIKLSQGAKPGHGGILPAKKLTPEIAAIRGVPLGQDVLSPPAHTAFDTPVGLIKFVQRLRELSGGKPVGFKLCVGKRREFLAVVKAMLVTGSAPDYIYVDGGEGGTGAAPLEFSNHVGTPGLDGLLFVHNALVGAGLRDRVKVLCSGKITSGFNITKLIAVGADGCFAARSFMMALGCIQALRCNTNVCPTGVATQDPELVAGLVVEDKKTRVARFHQLTIHSVAELLGAMGLKHTSELRPWHIMRRTTATDCHHYGEIHEYLRPGALLGSEIPQSFARAWAAASPQSFHYSEEQAPVPQSKMSFVAVHAG